jgi:hypothetical protein
MYLTQESLKAVARAQLVPHRLPRPVAQRERVGVVGHARVVTHHRCVHARVVQVKHELQLQRRTLLRWQVGWQKQFRGSDSTPPPRWSGGHRRHRGGGGLAPRRLDDGCVRMRG